MYYLKDDDFPVRYVSLLNRLNVPKKRQPVDVDAIQAVQEHLRREGHDVDTLILEIEARRGAAPRLWESRGAWGGNGPWFHGLCESQNPWGR